MTVDNINGFLQLSVSFGIGTMGPPKPDIPSMKKIGSLYCLDLDGSLRTVIQEVGISNGLAWSEDGKTMYYIDSTPRQMYRFDFDGSTGKIGLLTLISINTLKFIIFFFKCFHFSMFPSKLTH